ncbi:DUF1045 domain-containing protein [Yoonia sp. 2307UL14-13]|uniref:DUF1045 domain-containing protein n=1 Tax=Yoonia sp. 2307UL14-13 TaxID=3126506 RepID=UPI0030A3289A
MMNYSRFAIYYLPTGALAKAGATWLGWDVDEGTPCDQPDVTGIGDITATPRKYGFHGTLKPPFRLAEGTDADGLADAVQTLATTAAPVSIDSLHVSAIGRFLALIPRGDTTALANLAARIVQDLDAFRAPPSATELAKRRAAGLSPAQEANLTRWGYPYVLNEFRFHMTLSGKLDDTQRQIAQTALTHHLPPLPAPYVIDQIALVGERQDGMFQTIHRYALTG